MDSADMTPPPSGQDGQEPQATMVERAPVPPNVPNLLRVSPMDTTTATDVETSITDPVVRSDSFVRFTLLNKGILHSHSKITLQITAPDTTNDRFLPPTVGVHSLISRCALKVGTKTLQEIDGYNYLSAYKQMFVSNEHQKEREQVLSSKYVAHEFRYDVQDTTTGGADNDTRAFTYGLSNGKEYNSSYGNVTPDLKVNDWVNLKNNPQFQVALADLFPMLKQTQLPLYMMQEQVSIELTFEPSQLARACNAQGIASPLTFAVNTDEVKFIADYIYYPQEMMSAYAVQNPEITINHFDYRHSKVSVSATSTSGTTQIRNLGGAGRIVTKVVTGLQSNDTDDESITNQYHAISPESQYDFGESPAADTYNGSLTVNIKYNDRFLYPIDVVNPARHFHNTAQAEGMVPFVTREEFSAEGVALTTDEFMGYSQQEGDAATEKGVLGRFNWLAFRLNRNERINSRGLEYYWKYEGLDNGGGYTQRAWLELAKITVLQAGYVTTRLL